MKEILPCADYPLKKNPNFTVQKVINCFKHAIFVRIQSSTSVRH